MTKTNKTSDHRVVERTGPQLEGRYANYFKVGHNAYEFVIDFGQYHAENDQAELYTRIIANPAYARELLRLLSDSMAQYEKEFGRVKQLK